MGYRGGLSGGGIPRAQQHSQAKAKGRARPTRCVALQPAHPRGTRRRERTCVVGARQAGAKTIKGLRSCRTNRPGPSNAVPQISTIHERAASNPGSFSPRKCLLRRHFLPYSEFCIKPTTKSAAELPQKSLRYCAPSAVSHLCSQQKEATCKTTGFVAS